MSILSEFLPHMIFKIPLDGSSAPTAMTHSCISYVALLCWKERFSRVYVFPAMVQAPSCSIALVVKLWIAQDPFDLLRRTETSFSCLKSCSLCTRWRGISNSCSPEHPSIVADLQKKGEGHLATDRGPGGLTSFRSSLLQLAWEVFMSPSYIPAHFRLCTFRSIEVCLSIPLFTTLKSYDYSFIHSSVLSSNSCVYQQYILTRGNICLSIRCSRRF